MGEKKRVGIITHFHGSTNYGGVLQAYALRKVIADMGYEAEQLRFDRTYQNIQHESLLMKVSRLAKTHLTAVIQNRNILQFIMKGFQYVFSIAVSIIFGKLYRNKRKAERRKNFKEFSRKYVPSSKIYNENTIVEATDDYDVFVTGSDQVWNPNWYSAEFFLSFAPDNKPKIAYAASVGVDNLTEEQYAFMQPMIQRLDCISVREENAVSLLQDMTDKKIEWVLDPTLLLSAEEWDEVAAENPVKEPYVFAYILANDKECYTFALNMAREKKLKLVTVPFSNIQHFRNRKDIVYSSYGGPDEWLALIRDAEYVITNSFHGIVFSTLYKKKFIVPSVSIVGPNKSLNSRIYSLLSLFPEISRGICCTDSKILEDNRYASGLEYKLKKEREKSILWLSSILKYD